MTHREHAVHTCLDQPRCDGAENGRLADAGTAASVEDDEWNLMLREKIGQAVGADGILPWSAGAVAMLLEIQRA